MQEILLQGVILLFSFKLVLTQSYRLLVEDVSPVRLSCCACDMSTGDSADIDDVKFWRNRTAVNNLGLREKRDVPVFEDEMENGITFILTRKFEGYYTCGQQVKGTVEESPPVFLVCKLAIEYILLCLQLIFFFLQHAWCSTICQIALMKFSMQFLRIKRLFIVLFSQVN